MILNPITHKHDLFIGKKYSPIGRISSTNWTTVH